MLHRLRFLLTCSATALGLAPLQAAIEIPADAEHLVSGTVTGTLVVIDVPTLSKTTLGTSAVFTPAAPGGPVWVTGTPAGTIAHPADNGFYVQTTVGDIYGTRSPWEPDGTPLDEADNYGAYNGTDPEVSYFFNLADSGIDFPDGAVINAVYTTWNNRGVDNGDFVYAEGANTGTVNVPFNVAPRDDLVLRWYDDANAGHDARFQRLFTGPITVEGGDGFRLNLLRKPNTAHIDAVVVDVSGAGAAGVPFAITAIDYDADASRVSLTWTSQPATSYIVKYSLDLADGWTSDLGDGLTAMADEVPDDGDQITVTFDLTEPMLENAEALFFRVEEE